MNWRLSLTTVQRLEREGIEGLLVTVQFRHPTDLEAAVALVVGSADVVPDAHHASASGQLGKSPGGGWVNAPAFASNYLNACEGGRVS